MRTEGVAVQRNRPSNRKAFSSPSRRSEIKGRMYLEVMPGTALTGPRATRGFLQKLIGWDRSGGPERKDCRRQSRSLYLLKGIYKAESCADSDVQTIN